MRKAIWSAVLITACSWLDGPGVANPYWGEPVGTVLLEQTVVGYGWYTGGSGANYVTGDLFYSGSASGSLTAISLTGQKQVLLTLGPTQFPVAIAGNGLYVVASLTSKRTELVRLPLNGGPPDTVVRGIRNVKLPIAIVTPDERFVAFVAPGPDAPPYAPSNARDSVAVFDRQTGVRRVYGPPFVDSIGLLGISPDGSQVAFVRKSGSQSIAVLDVATGVETWSVNMLAFGGDIRVPSRYVAWRAGGPRFIVTTFDTLALKPPPEDANDINPKNPWERPVDEPLWKRMWLWAIDAPGTTPTKVAYDSSQGALGALAMLDNGDRLLVAENIVTNRVPRATIAVYRVSDGNRSIVVQKEYTYVAAAMGDHLTSAWPSVSPDGLQAVIRSPRGLRVIGVP